MAAEEKEAAHARGVARAVPVRNDDRLAALVFLNALRGDMSWL
jgi:hypothetical protein